LDQRRVLRRADAGTASDAHGEGGAEEEASEAQTALAVCMEAASRDVSRIPCTNR
jgi:hypothetical protein